MTDSAEDKAAWTALLTSDWYTDEPKYGVEPSRESKERSLRLIGATGNPRKAAELVKISDTALMRIGLGLAIRKSVLATFEKNLDRAEALAHPMWRARLDARLATKAAAAALEAPVPEVPKPAPKTDFEKAKAMAAELSRKRAAK